ncbi:ABC transporter ATP-binding protein [Gulosibacter sp. 10]|uniref:dipeptide ABC transporter ATP-binding protein n=1 Tax=Gulosibacter sp. 10 TaxID=1255570 RepID=UPI00097F0F35|nr:ABC transporter ATP-binding protein [Gulosibacter sp. 10]SJM56657.1 Oligopeptide transport ATP-binding protein OppF (TC 3.A.1.5.1) [Gulosibacter sp. 10]
MIGTERDGASDYVLEVEDLSVHFPSEAGPVQAVRGLDYRVRRGESLAIVGESGSGKSVSSLAVMGLLPQSARISGAIRFKGENLLEKSDAQLSKLRGDQISMVFQDPLSALTPVYRIGDQIAETVLAHRQISKSEAQARAVELLDAVGIPNAKLRARSFPHEFSGGMRQRAMIAMAIANDPDLIIADEPTTALDVTIQAQVMELLRTAQEVTGAATVLITHDLGVVSGFADRVMVMYAGKAVEFGDVESIYRTPRMPYTKGLLSSIPRIDATEKEPLTPIEGTPPSLVDVPRGCPFAARCPIATDLCREEEPQLTGTDKPGILAACHHSDVLAERGDIFARPELPEPALRAPREERDRVLELDGVERIYPLTKGSVVKRKVGSVRAVDGVSFDIREGETLGLVGESGCGKTTTIMEIMQLQAPQTGEISIDGRNVTELNRKEKHALRAEMAMVFQDPMASLDPRMPVGDILREPMRVQGYDEERMAKRVDWLLKTVGLLPEQADRYPQEFSGGQRQRIGIARALACDPRIVVLDEPVSALDVSIQAGVINLLDELKNRLGLSYLFVSHDLSVVSHIADRVAVMYLGKIVELGSTEEIFRGELAHPYTRALLSAIPIPDPEIERRRERIVLHGDLPSPADTPTGCRFVSRCYIYQHLLDEQQRARCESEMPPLAPLEGRDHAIACYYPEKTAGYEPARHEEGFADLAETELLGSAD